MSATGDALEDGYGDVSFSDDALPPEPMDEGAPPEIGYRHDGLDAPGGRAIETGPQVNLQAEQATLGAMLSSKVMVPEIMSFLHEEDFYKTAHQTIYRAIELVFSNSDEVDSVLVAGQLQNMGELERIGGAPYLHTLVSMVPSPASGLFYAKLVAEKATMRRLTDAGHKIVALGQINTADAEPEKIVDEAEQVIMDVNRAKQGTGYQAVSELLDPVLAEISELVDGTGEAMGVPTGFVELDNLTNGLHGGQMIIVAARPGVGKSTLAMDFVRAASIKRRKTDAARVSAVFSLEMSKSEIMMRILSAESNVKLEDIRKGRLDDHAMGKLLKVTSRMEEAPIFIDDSPTLTMMEIRSKARDIKRKHGLDLVVVDYLQLMTSGRRVESRQQEVSDFSRQLKLLAKELDVPVVAISQLNRGPESRTDKKPQVADLRESGSLEQDADMVMLLYRPDSQEPDHERSGEADIILAKHRGGPPGTVQVANRLHCCKFENLRRE